MSSDLRYDVFQHYGTNAERLAFTPNPAVSSGYQPIYIWFETDTGEVWLYDTGWNFIGSVTAAAAAKVLTADPASPADDDWWFFRDGGSPTESFEFCTRRSGVTLRFPIGTNP